VTTGDLRVGDVARRFDSHDWLEVAAVGHAPGSRRGRSVGAEITFVDGTTTRIGWGADWQVRGEGNE
jgi:hypothetical protein